MALFPRDGGQANPPPLERFATERDNKTVPLGVLRSIHKALDKLRATVAGRLSFGTFIDGGHTGNFDGQFREFTSTTRDMEVPHGLGRVPTGWLPIDQNAGGHLFRDVTKGWTEEVAYLSSDAVGVTFRVIFF